MTATTVPAQTDHTTSASRPDYRLTFPRLVRSETLKLFTLRSTWWSLGVTVVLAIGISLMIAAASREFMGEYNPVLAVVAPMQFTALVAGILGAIAVTGEYSTGMIRSTLTAEPRRGRIVAAKAVVIGLVFAVTTVITSAISIAAITPFVSETPLDWADPERTVVPLLFGVVAMATFALLGVAWGFIIRNGAGAIAATVGVLFVLPIVLSLFSIGGETWAWLVDLGRYLPLAAAQTVTVPGSEGFAGAVVTLLAWPAVGLALGWTVRRTRAGTNASTRTPTTAAPSTSRIGVSWAHAMSGAMNSVTGRSPPRGRASACPRAAPRRRPGTRWCGRARPRAAARGRGRSRAPA